MGIHSMTGFGRAIAHVADWHYAVEIRSVNHRFLDVRVRAPRELATCETESRSRANRRLFRGRIEIALQAIEVEINAPARVLVNMPLARAHAEAHRRLAEELGIVNTLDTVSLAEQPGVIMPADVDLAQDVAQIAIGSAVDKALDLVIEMRGREGDALAREMRGRLDSIEQILADLDANAPEQNDAYRRRLESRIRELVVEAGLDLDKGRILHEVGVFAEKVDVAEELARLTSHVSQARHLIDTPTAGASSVGRRLDFLFQEMHREANTIGSKIQSLALSERVIDLKAELERLREQAQNVE